MTRAYVKPKVFKDSKECTKCNVVKPFEDFHKRAAHHTGYSTWCKPCTKNYDDAEHDPKRVFPRKINESGKIHCRNCGEYFKEEEMQKLKSGKYTSLTYCNECSPLLYRVRLVQKYGITVEQYHQMLEEQKYCCKICGMKESTYRKRLSIDHNHSCCAGTGSCGKCVRGLICHHCNAGLGNAKDSVEILQKMIEYLSN